MKKKVNYKRRRTIAKRIGLVCGFIGIMGLFLIVPALAGETELPFSQQLFALTVGLVLSLIFLAAAGFIDYILRS